MSDQKQGFDNKKNAPKSTQGAEQTSSAWKRLLSKRWVFPAVYVVAAAIIVTIVWGAYNNASKSADPASYNTTQTDNGESATNGIQTVNGKQETMKWPVKDRNEVEVILPFYDVNANLESRELATLQYGDTFIPNTGLGLARKDNQTFDVLAALTGKVTRVDKDPIVGNLVEVTHNNGLVTVYQSLQTTKAVKDAEVKQGEVIGTAGRNDLEKAQGVHLHFEIRQTGGSVLNPEQYLGLHEDKDVKKDAKEDATKQGANKDATKQDAKTDVLDKTQSENKDATNLDKNLDEKKPEDGKVKQPEANKDKTTDTNKDKE